MVIWLERGADLHMAQMMPLPLTVSCFSKIQIGFTFLVPAYPGGPGKRAIKRVCIFVCYLYILIFMHCMEQVLTLLFSIHTASLYRVVTLSEVSFVRFTCYLQQTCIFDSFLLSTFWLRFVSISTSVHHFNHRQCYYYTRLMASFPRQCG